jgi:hypothetical protein
VCIASLSKSFQEFPSACALSHTAAGVVDSQTAGELLAAKRDERGRGRSLVVLCHTQPGTAGSARDASGVGAGDLETPAVGAAIQFAVPYWQNDNVAIQCGIVGSLALTMGYGHVATRNS